MRTHEGSVTKLSGTCIHQPHPLIVPTMDSNSDSQCCGGENLRGLQTSASPELTAEVRPSKPRQQEYNFVEEPPPEYFCPVTSELLRDPKQTECCGHHISGVVVARVQREGKSCPLCNDPNFTVISDKYFKRKANELKVRCPHKRNGCKWEGQLGDLDHHSNSCSKRPWQCQHCDFRGTYEIGTTDHLPNCTKYPEPCPNQCDIGTVPHCDMEKHLTECPLQLVECEFAQAGCQERIPRQDMSRHMEEGAQRHLLNMSLLNLSLTRELHQKMTEKDQQITELQGQLQEQSRKLEEQGKQTEKQLQKQLETGLTGLQSQIQEQDGKVTDLQQKAKKEITGVQEQFERKLTEQQEDTIKQISGMQTQLQDMLRTALLQGGGIQALLRQSKQIPSSLLVVSGFRPPFVNEFTLSSFSVYKAKGGRGVWESDPFYSHPRGYKFKLNIHANGHTEAKRNHITADLWPQKGEYDSKLSWPIQVTAHLQLLNQRGDHRHVVASLNTTVTKDDEYIEIARKFIAHSELGCNAVKDTKYLINDSLWFKLYLKVTPKMY